MSQLAEIEAIQPHKRILFVDDEKSILDGLRRMLRPYRKEWDMAYVTTGDDALKLLNEKKFDAIVSDMRMPHMDGAKLLSIVSRLYPDVVRIALSGYADSEMTMESIHALHQFIAKPAQPEQIKEVISRTLALRDFLSDSSLREAITGVESIPTLPSVYSDLMQEIASEDCSAGEIGKIIEKDLGLSATTLKLVNSAFFGLARHVSSPVEATTMLGVDTIKNLALASKVFSSLMSVSSSPGEIEQLNGFAQHIAKLAKAFAKNSVLSAREKDHAHVAGMLSSLGDMLAVCILKAKPDGSVPGFDNTYLGGYLTGIWGFPFPLVEAVTYHRSPSVSQSTQLSPLSIVHAAWALTNAYMHECDSADIRQFMDLDYLENAVGEDQLQSWIKIAERFANEGI